jgi:elongation factor P
VYVVVECEHAKLGRGSAFCRARLRNLKTSQVVDCTLRDSDKIEDAFIEKRKLQYSYRQDEIYHFIDLESYEDLVLDKSRIEEKVVWLKDSLVVEGIFYQNELINLEVPLSLELKVIDTEPGFRGNTVKMGTKPAKLETDLIVQVPLFINTGDVIKVDTRTREYLGRA